ncbi:COG5377 Phage-related protein, predicted endonuclease [uncultured Caudovirales phage]|uniref:COG5377 Phage-related protein, predicted endonuclease n=1 Tax=uncultured Caudovirales phage TaxID=2100421 RepID=A0A6J5PL53_9CAUD|nr:COG5377 Phage-related protein, predicted endonuclease [uncultured Caudovirales phage]
MERNEWLLNRRKGLGASDIPAIMKVSPWSTPYQLFCDKVSTEPPVDNGNWATARGNTLEPIARARYELESGLEFPATLAVHKDVPYFMASLDGYNAEHNFILEIKCPGAADHATAVSGAVPEKYFPQLQHQLMVTGAAECHYVSYDGAESLALVVVKPNYEYIAAMVEKEHAFWKLVTDGTPPELCDADVKVIDHLGLHDLANKYIELDAESKAIDIEMKKLRELILADEEITSHPRCLIGRLNVTRSYRAGTIDYSKIEGVDFEAYRKKGTTTVTITIKKL